jgi:hypothetical protein
VTRTRRPEAPAFFHASIATHLRACEDNRRQQERRSGARAPRWLDRAKGIVGEEDTPRGIGLRPLIRTDAQLPFAWAASFRRVRQAVILRPALRQRGLLFDRARYVAAAVRRRGFFPFNQCIDIYSLPFTPRSGRKAVPNASPAQKFEP